MFFIFFLSVFSLRISPFWLFEHFPAPLGASHSLLPHLWGLTVVLPAPIGMAHLKAPEGYCSTRGAPRQVLLRGSDAEIAFFVEVTEALESQLDAALTSCEDVEATASFLRDAISSA